MIQRVQEYLTGLDWGLTDEQTAELAEWLVDIYLENYETVYGEPSGIYQSVSRLEETLLEQMRTDLESISEYLTTLDASVTNNKEELLQLTEAYVRRRGGRKLALSAQIQAQGFYEKCGFAPMGEVYLDEFCPHIHMEKELTA